MLAAYSSPVVKRFLNVNAQNSIMHKRFCKIPFMR
jgi:hypothetical protein